MSPCAGLGQHLSLGLVAVLDWAGDGAAPDFSADTSPSLAPANDVRPRPRPARD